MKVWIILVAAIVIETIATSALRFSAGFTKLVPSAIVICGYAMSFYLLSLTLKDIPVGIAYAAWAGIGITLITVVGWIFLGQRLGAGQILGFGLIAIGVIVLRVFTPPSAA